MLNNEVSGLNLGGKNGEEKTWTEIVEIRQVNIGDIGLTMQ